MTHDDYKLAGGILFYSDGTDMIATLGRRESTGELSSGKLLSKQELKDALGLMDKKERNAFMPEPKWIGERGGDILLSTADDTIWYSEPYERTLWWGNWNADDGGDKESAVYQFPALIWRWQIRGNLVYLNVVGAPHIDRKHPEGTILYRIKLPNMDQNGDVHQCGMMLSADLKLDDIEDTFFGSQFTSKPADGDALGHDGKGDSIVRPHHGSHWHSSRPKVGMGARPIGTLHDFYYATYK